MEKLRLAIIGCKNMGNKHYNILKEYFGEKVEVVGIMNSTPQSSQTKAQEMGLPYFKSLEEISRDNVDAVIIATPATTHCEVGKAVLAKKIPCLIEKPLASTPEECNELLKAAKKNKTFMMVGHTENYNPAVTKLKEVLNSDVIEISAIRTSKNAGVKRDISVIFELMIHDIAIVMDLLPGIPVKVSTTTKEGKDQTEHAVVEMEYKNGAKVRLESLIDFVPVERVMNIKDKAGNIYFINFIDRLLTKNGEVLINEGISLKEELADFIACVKGKKYPEINAQRAKDIVEMCALLQK